MTRPLDSSGTYAPHARRSPLPESARPSSGLVGAGSAQLGEICVAERRYLPLVLISEIDRAPRLLLETGCARQRGRFGGLSL
jgi:hypothetical protein